jgi:hypothetical protein
MLVVAMVFGFSQWRRQWLLRAEKTLDAQGANILIGDDWFWPIASSSASLSVNKNSDGTFLVGAERLSEDEAMERFRTTIARMHEIGVTVIKIEVVAIRSDGMMEGMIVGEEWLD